MKIHKIEAAQRQLDTALSLFFSQGDTCAVLALAAASEEVLGHYIDGEWVKDKPNNMFRSMFRETLALKLGYRNEQEFSRQLVNRTKNALKHANSEHEHYILINHEEAVVRLMLALMEFQTGSGKPFSQLMTKFEAWLIQNRPNYLGPTTNG